MAAALDDAAVIEHGDLIRHAHGGEAVGDENRDAIACELAEMLEHFGLGLRIHGSGGLIEHQHVGARAHEGARQRNLLPLPAGQLAAIAKPLAELRSIAGGQRLDELARLALARAASRQRASSSKYGSSPAPTFSPTSIW